MDPMRRDFLFTLLGFLLLGTSSWGQEAVKIDAGAGRGGGEADTISVSGRLLWHNPGEPRQTAWDNSIPRGQSDSVVQLSESRLLHGEEVGGGGGSGGGGGGGGAAAGQLDAWTQRSGRDDRQDRRATEGQAVPKTEASQNGPVVALTQFSSPDPHQPRQEKKTIDSARAQGHDGKTPVRAYPGRSNDRAKMMLGASDEFAEQSRVWRVNRNISFGYYQLRRTPFLRASVPESIFLPKMERLRGDAKASYIVGYSDLKKGSPGVVSTTAAIDREGKYVVDINVNKLAVSNGVRALTSDFNSRSKRASVAAITENEVNSNKGEGATKEVLARARRDTGNYTVGTEADQNDNGTSSDSDSMVDVVTVAPNDGSTARPPLSSQSTQETTLARGGAGSGVGTSSGTVPTRATTEKVSGQASSTLFTTAQAKISTQSSSVSPSTKAGIPVASSVKTTSTEPPATTKTPTDTTTTTKTTTPTAAAVQTTVETSSSASTTTTTTSTTTTTTKASPPSTAPASSTPTVTTAQETQSGFKTSGPNKTTATAELSTAGSGKTDGAETTQGPGLSVGKSVDGGNDSPSSDPSIQESSADSSSVAESSVQPTATVSVTSSTDAARTSAGAGVGHSDTSTHRVSRSSDATPAPATTATTTTTTVPAPPAEPSTSSSLAGEVTTQPPAPSTQAPEITTVDQSTILSDSHTTEAPPATVTSDPPAASTDDMAGGQDPMPEGEPYPEPTEAPGSLGDSDEIASAEPGPDWSMAKMAWGEAWELHLYFFGGLFGLLGVYTLVCVLRLWSIHRLLSRRYFVSLNLLMLLLCSTRSVYLLLDGYNSNRTFHPSLDYFLYSISFPCLSSAFSIQLYALLQATKMQFLPPTIQKMSMLIIVMVFHFAISIATDVVVGMYAGMRIMLFVCQLFFILWGLFLFFGYAYIFRRLYLHAVKRQKNVIQKTGSYSMTGSISKPKSKFTLSVAVKVTFSTAILGLVTVGLEIYGLLGVYKTLSNGRPEPWPFYIYHTALRLIEFLMCATMSYVASQPFRYRRRRQCCCCPVLCAPCAEICCCGAEVNRSNSLAGWSDIDQHQLRASFDRGNVQNVSYQHDGVSNGNGVARNGGGVDLTVAAKTRIYFKDRADVMPILTSQPTSESNSRPTSANSDFVDENTMSTRGSRGSVTGSIDGSAAFNNPYRAVHSPTDSKRFFPNSGRTGLSSSTPVKTRDGVVNTAYSSTTDDPQSPGGFASSKSRNGSIASSEFFLAPSVSLADSMASELDKAFRSMHEDEEREPVTMGPGNTRAVSTPSLPSLHEALEPDTGRKGGRGEGQGEPPFPKGHATFPESSIQRFLQQQQQHSGELPAGMVLRRARSAIGRCSFQEVEPLKGGEGPTGRCSSPTGTESGAGPWHMKLFRSRSDNTGALRTKDVENARYTLLPDLERDDLLVQRQHTQPKAAGGSSSTPRSDSAKPDSSDHGARDPSSPAPTSPDISKHSLMFIGRNISACGEQRDLDTPTKDASSRNRRSRLKYRDDESDDIEV